MPNQLSTLSNGDRAALIGANQTLAAMNDAFKGIARARADIAGRMKPKKPRSPPRLDPVKSAAKAVAKNPELVARFRPDGTLQEIANKGTVPANETETETPETLKRLI
jgi:hypothetical protein